MSNKENREPEIGHAFCMEPINYTIFYESEEDTDDASETARTVRQESYFENKEEAYRDKLKDFKDQQKMLRNRTHPVYRQGEEKLKAKFVNQQFKNKILYESEVERILREHEIEQIAAFEEFFQKEKELRETLKADMEEKKKIIEAERDSMDITSEIVFLQNPIRKQRRRANDLSSAPEPKRKKVLSSLTLKLKLNDDEINDDLEKINELTAERLSQVNDSSKGLSNGNKILSDIRVENGKLYYEKYWYHRGQQIFYEEDGRKHSAVISTINPIEVWVRRSSDNEKYQINISSLIDGIVTFKRRSA